MMLILFTVVMTASLDQQCLACGHYDIVVLQGANHPTNQPLMVPSIYEQVIPFVAYIWNGMQLYVCKYCYRSSDNATAHA